MIQLRRFGIYIFLFLVSINIYFASWYVRHGDISFISDIARDMFLLQEISQKKLILIGPRSSVFGLYHGPLWAYLNYPAYVLGKGNPLAIGWNWIFLICIFLFTNYWIAKKLFSSSSAKLYILMMSLYFVFHANELFNPYGALFVLPAFFYFFVRYIQTQKVYFLIWHILFAGLLIQFQMAIGVPMLILSLVYTMFFSIKNQHTRHLLAYNVILLPLSTFILFDIRHGFLMFHNILRHLATHDKAQTMIQLVQNRVETVLFRTEFLRWGPPVKFFSDNGQAIVTMVLILFLAMYIFRNSKRDVYLLFLYFYIGYFLLSLMNRYDLLSFYVSPLISLVFLIFSSFTLTKRSYIFYGIFFIIYACNIVGAYKYIQASTDFIGKSQFSWKALYEISTYVYSGPEKEFGYFVYSPDILGYAPRYALEYGRETYHKNGFAFTRKPLTYLIIETAAKGNIFTSEQIFKTSQVHFDRTPTHVQNFPNGYKVDTYQLQPNELNIPFDPGINPGLHYR